MIPKDPTVVDEFDFELLPDDAGDIFEQLHIGPSDAENENISYDNLHQGELQF